MSSVCVRVSVPFCTFRRAHAREFMESETVPPPATVYGFLLSLIGEEDRTVYIGAKIAIAIANTPHVAHVLRTAWRVKYRNHLPGLGPNRRPDYQQVLCGLDIGVWIAAGGLEQAIRSALRDPTTLPRYGGLSLGESRDLVNDVTLDPAWEGKQGRWLARNVKGRHPLPIWVDHVGSKGTRWEQFSYELGVLKEPKMDDRKWILIEPAH